MDIDRVLKDAKAFESRILQFEKFIEELTVQNKALQKEEERKNKQLRKLNLEINKLQMKKEKIDLKFTNKIDVDSLTDQIKEYSFLNTHLDALNQRKHILEKYTLQSGLELEEETLKKKLEDVTMYFGDKHSELDDNIKNEELKLANRHKLVSKMCQDERKKYKTWIEKLRVENNTLQRKLNRISNYQTDHIP